MPACRCTVPPNQRENTQHHYCKLQAEKLFKMELCVYLAHALRALDIDLSLNDLPFTSSPACVSSHDCVLRVGSTGNNHGDLFRIPCTNPDCWSWDQKYKGQWKRDQERPHGGNFINIREQAQCGGAEHDEMCHLSNRMFKARMEQLREGNQVLAAMQKKRLMRQKEPLIGLLSTRIASITQSGTRRLIETEPCCTITLVDGDEPHVDGLSCSHYVQVAAATKTEEVGTFALDNHNPHSSLILPSVSMPIHPNENKNVPPVVLPYLPCIFKSQNIPTIPLLQVVDPPPTEDDQDQRRALLNSNKALLNSNKNSNVVEKQTALPQQQEKTVLVPEHKAKKPLPPGAWTNNPPPKQIPLPCVTFPNPTPGKDGSGMGLASRKITKQAAARSVVVERKNYFPENRNPFCSLACTDEDKKKAPSSRDEKEVEVELGNALLPGNLRENHVKAKDKVPLKWVWEDVTQGIFLFQINSNLWQAQHNVVWRNHAIWWLDLVYLSQQLLEASKKNLSSGCSSNVWGHCLVSESVSPNEISGEVVLKSLCMLGAKEHTWEHLAQILDQAWKQWPAMMQHMASYTETLKEFYTLALSEWQDDNLTVGFMASTQKRLSQMKQLVNMIVHTNVGKKLDSRQLWTLTFCNLKHIFCSTQDHSTGGVCQWMNALCFHQIREMWRRKRRLSASRFL